MAQYHTSSNGKVDTQKPGPQTDHTPGPSKLGISIGNSEVYDPMTMTPDELDKLGPGPNIDVQGTADYIKKKYKNPR